MSKVRVLVGTRKGAFVSDVGRQAREVGRERSAFRGLGDLSREGIAGRSEPALRLAIERLVRADDPAVERRRQNGDPVGNAADARASNKFVYDAATGKPLTRTVVRRHAASVGIQARVASGAFADRSGHGVRGRGGRGAVPVRPTAARTGRNSPGCAATVRDRNWQPGAGGMCLHTIILDPSDPKRMFIAISAAGAFRTDDGGETWKPDQPRAALAIHSRSDCRGRALRSSHRDASGRGRACCSCRSTGT